MEQLLGFAATVILVSSSGVMSPGPLFATNIFYGLKEGAKGGLKMAIGHTVIELPLIILLGIGIVSLESFPQFRIIIATVGALGLFGFAGLQLKSAFNKNGINQNTRTKYGPFLSGVLFSGLNPFFIIWWFTIGFKLISDSIMIWSLGGLLVLFGLHIWMDFAWLASTAYLSSKGSKFLSQRNFRFVFVSISGLLIYFGITFLLGVFA